MIGILTDSTCDIPQPLLDQYDITVIPNTLIWGGRQYRDRVDLTPQEFYRRLATDPQRPTSATPSQPDFQRAYREVVRKGASELVVLTISSAMSGVYQLALKAAEQAGVPVSVIDSKGPTMTLGWQVLAAARAREAGATRAEILEQVARVRNNLMQLVSMNTLEYLQRGGRIGNAVKWVGILLQVKPLVSINHQTGLVEPVSLARTHSAGVELMYDRFTAFLGGKPNLHIAVLHGDVLAEAERLAARLRAQLNPSELLINMTGPVLGLNTGPGALALCGYAEDW